MTATTGYRHRSHSKMKPTICRFSVVDVVVLVVISLDLDRCSRHRHHNNNNATNNNQKSIIKCNRINEINYQPVTTTIKAAHAAAAGAVLNMNNLLVLVGTSNLGLKINDHKKDNHDVANVVMMLSNNFITNRPIPISFYYYVLTTDARIWEATRPQLNLAVASIILSLSCVVLLCFSIQQFSIITLIFILVFFSSKYLIGRANNFCNNNLTIANFNFNFTHNLLKFNYCDIRTLLMDRRLLARCQRFTGTSLQF
jgi:hypothetical protein